MGSSIFTVPECFMAPVKNVRTTKKEAGSGRSIKLWTYDIADVYDVNVVPLHPLLNMPLRNNKSVSRQKVDNLVQTRL